MSFSTQNILEFVSDPKGINLTADVNSKIFEKVFFKDSMLKFYPYAEVYLRDTAGIIISNYFFIEGMKFDTKLGSPEVSVDNKTVGGYLTHTYAWSEDQILRTRRDSEYLSGTNCFILLSNTYFQDYVNPIAYQDQPSSIAKNIASDSFNIIDSDKLFIEETANDVKNIWYQGNRFGRDFLEQTLVRNAYSAVSSNADKTAFVSFINCNGEFYFCSYDYLYRQTPVATFEAKVTLDKLTDTSAIQEISFICGGAPVNRKLYNQSIYKIEDDGTIASEDILLADKYLSTNNGIGSYPVNKNNASSYKRIFDAGIIETYDAKKLTARESFDYQDSSISNRIEIVIIFNPLCISGKTVELKIKNATDNDNYSSELSGVWLIIESEHMLAQNDVIYSHLVLAKPSITFSNKFNYSDLVISN